jgi:hypothetical protein
MPARLFDFPNVFRPLDTLQALKFIHQGLVTPSSHRDTLILCCHTFNSYTKQNLSGLAPERLSLDRFTFLPVKRRYQRMVASSAVNSTLSGRHFQWTIEALAQDLIGTD